MSKKHEAAFRDLTDKKDVVFHGPGSFQIGLSADGNIVVETKYSDAVCVVLLELTADPSGGYILAPANWDLPCFINESEELTGEINLIDGTRLEVANKTLVFFDGPIPVRRRKLPRTPGMPLEDGPPSKPVRVQNVEKDLTLEIDPEYYGENSTSCSLPPGSNEEHSDDNNDSEKDEDRRWLETSWCKLDLPTAEQYLFADLNTPEQISIVAASYVCKQVRLFTDANPTMHLLDDIFKLFKDSVMISKDVFLNYLCEISEKIRKSPQCTQTRPMHGPAIKLLNDLLKQALEPLSRVILLLDLLRTFSHFDSNMPTMIRHQVPATILGCMTVHYDVVEVQSYGLDALARIAKFKLVIDNKAPLREGAVQIVLKSEHQHHKDLAICRSVCRVLANLAASFTDIINSIVDTEVATNSAVTEAVENYEGVLLFMYKRALPVVQTILDDHGADLGVRTEGRKFVFYYAKLPQLQQKKKIWIEASLEETEVRIVNANDASALAIQDLKAYKEEENEPRSILKKAGSFEDLRDPNKRIVFADNTVGGSESDSSSSDDESFKPPFEYKIPTEIELEEDFSQHIMKTFIKRTFGKKKYKSDLSDSSDDENLTIRKSVENLKPSRFELDNKSSEYTNAPGRNNVKEEISDVSLTNAYNSIAQNDNSTIQNDQIYVEDTENRVKECQTENIIENETVTEPVSITNSNLIVDKHQDNCDIETPTFDRLQEPSSGSETALESNFLNNMNSADIISISDKLSVSHDEENSTDSSWDIVGNAELRDMTDGNTEPLTHNKDEINSDVTSSVSALDDTSQSEFHINDTPDQKAGSEVVKEVKGRNKLMPHTDRTKDCSVVDVPFLGKLVRTQIVTHVGSLVFQGDDSKVLLVIDQPITELLEHAAAPVGLVEFARNQYGKDMTLMDLEPSIVISAIDAVRYRSVTAELVQNAVLSLTRAITHTLHSSTVNITMLFYKALFTDSNIKSIITEKKFVQEFKVCFSNATQRLQTSHSIEEIRAQLSNPSFVV